MYQPGDYVICRSGGVWRVTEDDGAEVALCEHEDSRKKRVACGDEEIVRRIASKKTVVEAASRAGFIRTIQAPNDKIRRELYEDAMAQYDEIEWIRVIKSAYLRKEDRRVADYELASSEKAKVYFHGELSVCLGIPSAEAEKYIADAVDRDAW